MSNKSRRRRYFREWDRYVEKHQMTDCLGIKINDGYHRAYNKVEHDIITGMQTRKSEMALIAYLHKYFDRR